MSMPIQRASANFPGIVASEDVAGCQACGDKCASIRHAALGLMLCAECTKAANSLDDLSRGPAIQPGFCS